MHILQNGGRKVGRVFNKYTHKELNGDIYLHFHLLFKYLAFLEHEYFFSQVFV